MNITKITKSSDVSVSSLVGHKTSCKDDKEIKDLKIEEYRAVAGGPQVRNEPEV